MNDLSANYAELPRTAYFNHTLRRALGAAGQRTHRYVTLEHLLFALLDDPDAVNLLQTLDADVAGIRSAIADYINVQMAATAVPDARAPTFSYKFDSLTATASEDALGAGRREIDGALALIAVAKDPDSPASAILAQNGFDANAAVRRLARAARDEPRHASPPLALAPPRSRRPSSSGPAGLQERSSPPSLDTAVLSGAAREETIDDMLASVRNLLDVEERKARGLPLDGAALQGRAPHPETIAQIDADGGASRGGDALRQRPGARTEPQARQAASPAAAREGGVKADSRRTRARRGRGPERTQEAREVPAPLSNLLKNVPRRMRVAVPEIVEIRLSKEEGGALFESASGRGAAQAQAHQVPVSRAVTMRLRAPKGALFIETLSAETQWAFDRPSFLGNEEFGRWAWTLIPSHRGAHKLQISVSSRNIDEHGLVSDLVLPEYAIDVRARINWRRAIVRFVKSALFMAAGGVLTEGVIFLLKIFPH